MRYIFALYLLFLSVSVLTCSRNFSTDINLDSLSAEDKKWLEDNDKNGEPDSVEKFLGECTNLAGKCLAEAKKEREALVLYFHFDNIAGNRLPDNSLYANHANIYQTVLVQGVQEAGNAAAFNGLSSYAEVPDPSFLSIGSQSWTISLFVKTSTIHQNLAHLVSRNECSWTENCSPEDNSAYNISLYGKRTYFSLSSDNGNTLNAVDSTVSITDNNWHHVVGTLDRTSNKMNLYIDGELKVSLDAAPLDGINDSGSPLSLGRLHTPDPDPLEFPFSGALDEIRIYSRSLSKNEIQILRKMVLD